MEMVVSRAYGLQKPGADRHKAVHLHDMMTIDIVSYVRDTKPICTCDLYVQLSYVMPCHFIYANTMYIRSTHLTE